MEVIHLLIRTDIKGTNDNLLTCHCLCNGLISLELSILCRIIIGSEVEKLTTEEADAASIILKYGRDITHTTDIGIEVHLPAIKSNILLTLEFEQQALLLFVFILLLLIFFNLLSRRIDDQDSLITIYDTSLTIEIFREVHTNQSRNRHGTCKNCSMRIG